MSGLTDEEKLRLRKRWRYVFAASAMQGEIASQGLEGRDTSHIAAMACEMADALLDELESKP